MQIRGQPFGDDCCEVEPIHCCFLSHRISELARSSQQRANSQTSNLLPNPYILTRHGSTAELRVVGIETRRTEPLTEEASPESKDLSMCWLRTRETIISPFVGLAPSHKVLEKKGIAIVHGFWAHIGSIPWATSNRQTFPLALR